jgi:tRNA pseudouridine32 synthase/23S rRNA pseudouridine746 synthase/23S rRNA pseudouridine1911/1915/1917 synthase
MKANPKSKTLIFNFLQELYPESSKSTLRSLLEKGRVEVDGRRVKLANTEVLPSQTVEIVPVKKKVQRRLEVIYQDRDFIVINKPYGLLSVATNFETLETCHAILKKEFTKKVYVVHRLDQETSGVMLFALSEKGYNGLKELFQSHDITRRYTALVEGEIAPTEGTWESYLVEDSAYVVHETKDQKRGEKAITHYKVLEKRGDYSLLELTLQTGKKNQIRVHCQSAGIPVAGDLKYGAKTNPCKRLLLHATDLDFVHPVTGKQMHFHCKVPKCFNPIIYK